MRKARLALSFALCLLLTVPLLGQSMMEVRGRLLQAHTLMRSGQADQALKLLTEGLQALGKLGGEVTPLAADFHHASARAARALGDDVQAVRSFEAALGILQPLARDERARLGQVLLEFGDYQRAAQRNLEAVALYLRAVELEPKPPLPERIETAKMLHNLACAYRDLGDLKRASETFQYTLARKERLLAPDDSSLAITLNEFGGVCRMMGDYQQAERYLSRALEIRKAQRQKSPESYARVLNNLSLVKQATGEKRQALGLLKESLEVSLELHGPHHPETMVPQMNLAQLAASLGDFEYAEGLYRQALGTALENFGPDSLQVATVNHNLGGLMLEMADLEKAEEYLQRALEVRRRRLPANHPDLLPTLINLASVQRRSGKDDKAVQLYGEALEVGEASLGKEHPDLAYTLDLMAGVPSLADRPEEVLALTQRAHAIRQKAFGPKAVATAYSTYSLALWSHRQGQLEKARALFEDSWQVFRKELGSDHPYTGKAAYRLGLLALEEGRFEEALVFARREAQATLATTTEVFSFASERQRLAYSAQLRPYDLLASLGAAEELAGAVLRYKGAVLDSMMEDLSLARQSPEAAVQGRVDALLKVREQLSNLVADPSATPQDMVGAPQGRVAALREELERLETELARDGYGSQQLRRAFLVTPEEVTKALPNDSVLIELVCYGQLTARGQLEPSYGAVILAPGSRPTWVPLGPAKAIEGLVWRYKRFVRGRGAEAGDSDEVLGELYRVLWAPLHRWVPSDTKTLVLCPDGELSFVSFATLLDEQKRFLSDRFDVLYVSSGRDLLRESSRMATPQAVLLGDPEFPESSMEPLPYTRQECQSLAALLKSFPGWSVGDYLGDQASEARIKAVAKPRLLHIATHGYFDATRSRSTQDPMAASGLVLTAGALEGQDGQSEDGYLTAGEVSLLDLSGTSLVTLSACDTGLGLAQAGEGVLGLRRGFLKAGAQNLVMTLWSVPDQTTAEFMSDFFIQAKALPPALALARTQRSWLKRLSQERSPAEAARQVGPFVLNLSSRWTDSAL